MAKDGLRSLCPGRRQRPAPLLVRLKPRSAATDWTDIARILSTSKLFRRWRLPLNSRVRVMRSCMTLAEPFGTLQFKVKVPQWERDAFYPVASQASVTPRTNLIVGAQAVGEHKSCSSPPRCASQARSLSRVCSVSSNSTGFLVCC